MENTLQVTKVIVYPLKELDSKIKGMATVEINEALCLRELKIKDGVNGLFVAYPVDPFYQGEDYRSIYMPMTRQFREHLENAVLEEYQKAINSQKEG
ncbi:MAG: SpoVG family protein [Fibrobacter sp.]|nr:SpoVG family protein [Fibrobacter sp.]